MKFPSCKSHAYTPKPPTPFTLCPRICTMHHRHTTPHTTTTHLTPCHLRSTPLPTLHVPMRHKCKAWNSRMHIHLSCLIIISVITGTGQLQPRPVVLSVAMANRQIVVKLEQGDFFAVAVLTAPHATHCTALVVTPHACMLVSQCTIVCRTYMLWQHAKDPPGPTRLLSRCLCPYSYPHAGGGRVCACVGIVRSSGAL